MELDVATANAQVRTWLAEVADQRVHGTTGAQPAIRLIDERPALQALPPAWRGDIAAARPMPEQDLPAEPARPTSVLAHLETPQPSQPPLAIYDPLLASLRGEYGVAP